MARTELLKFDWLLCDRNFNTALRLRFIECYIWQQLLYGIETGLKALIKAFELWIYRIMLRIPCTARVTIKEVLRRMDWYRKLLRTIEVRKTAYLVQILRNEKYGLLQVILQGGVDGRKGISRKNSALDKHEFRRTNW